MIKGRVKKHAVNWQGEYASKFGGQFVGGTEKENIENQDKTREFRRKKSNRLDDDVSIDRAKLDRTKIAASVFSNHAGKPCHGIMPSRDEYLVLYDMYNDSLQKFFDDEKPQLGFTLPGLVVFYHIYIGPTTFCEIADGNRAINVPQQMLNAANANAVNGGVSIMHIRKMRNFAITKTMKFSYKDLKFSVDPFHFLDVVRRSYVHPPAAALAAKGQWPEASRREYTLKVRSYIKVLANKAMFRNPQFNGPKVFAYIRGNAGIDEFHMLVEADKTQSDEDAKLLRDNFYTEKNKAMVKDRVEQRRARNAEAHRNSDKAASQIGDKKRAAGSSLQEKLAAISLKEAIARASVSAILNSNLDNDSILIIFSYVSPYLWFTDLHLYRYIQVYLRDNQMDTHWGYDDDFIFHAPDPPDDFFRIFDDEDVVDDFIFDGNLNGANGEFTGSDDVAHASRSVNRDSPLRKEEADSHEIPDLVDVGALDTACKFCGLLHGRGGCGHSHGHKRAKNLQGGNRRIAEKLRKQKKVASEATRSQIVPCDSHCYCLKTSSFHVSTDDKREIFCFIAAKGEVDDAYLRLMDSIGARTQSDRAMLLLREKNGFFTNAMIDDMWDNWHDTGVGLCRQSVEVEPNVDSHGNDVEQIPLKFFTGVHVEDRDMHLVFKELADDVERRIVNADALMDDNPDDVSVSSFDVSDSDSCYSEVTESILADTLSLPKNNFVDLSDIPGDCDAISLITQQSSCPSEEQSVRDFDVISVITQESGCRSVNRVECLNLDGLPPIGETSCSYPVASLDPIGSPPLGEICRLSVSNNRSKGRSKINAHFALWRLADLTHIQFATVILQKFKRVLFDVLHNLNLSKMVTSNVNRFASGCSALLPPKAVPPVLAIKSSVTVRIPPVVAPTFGKGYAENEAYRRVNIGLNLEIDAQPSDDPIYKRVSVSIFKYLMYTKRKHSSFEGGMGQRGSVDSTEALGRSYLRAGVCSFADMLLFLPYITACSLSTISESAEVVADDICGLRKQLWGKASLTDKDRSLSNEEYDLHAGSFNYSEEVDIFSELFEMIWSSYTPLSATGSSVTLTNVFTHMPGKVGEKVAQLCNDKGLTGYMKYANSVTVLNTIIYFVQVKAIQFSKGQGGLSRVCDQVKNARQKI